MTKVICDICKENRASFKVSFNVTDNDSFLGLLFNELCSPSDIDMCFDCYKKTIGSKTYEIHCETCADRNKCAIHDNFNIKYCSDWQHGSSIKETKGD